MNKIYNNIEKYFSSGDRVVVGVSGGADSMALIHALQHCGMPLTLHAAHLNHMLRGDESLRDEAFVSEYCKKNNLNYSVRRIDIKSLAKEQGISEELCGRNERYRFFQSLAGNGLIATAHTLSDKVETLLFNLTRGSSLAGLCSIPQRRGNIVRPMIDIERSEIEEYCERHNVEYLNDSTNLSTKYSRNKIRLKVVPVLKEINPSFEQSAYRMMKSLADDRDYLNSQARQSYRRCLNDSKLDLELLNALPPAVKSRVIAIYLEENNIAVDYNTVQEAQRLSKSASGRYNASGNMYIVAAQGLLRIEKPVNPIPYFEHIINENTDAEAVGFHFSIINQEDYKQLTKVKKNFLYLVVDYDKLIGNVKIRKRIAGDSIHLPKRPSKSLKKLFNELKIPLRCRDSLAVFADNQGVFAVEGIGIDRRVAPDSTTNRFLYIKKLKGKADDRGH